MTFKELLDCVQFADVAPHIVKMYPDMRQSLGWYKIHFDMLRLMQPVFHEDANDKVCHITMEDWEDGSGLHLDAYPMEGDLWEHSLTKELIIEQGIKATNEELAACCLWHTSFYGFVEKQVDEHFRINDLDMATLDRWNNSLYYKDSMWFGSVPLNKIKRKKRFRIEFLEHYYERMTVISDFIVQAIRALKDARNYMRVEQLCELFQSELFCTEEIMSYASNGESGAKYLYELFTSYDMIPKMDGIVVRLVTGTEHEVLTEDENLLCNLLAEGRKYGDLILDYDPALSNQVVISYAAYNSNYPLVK